MYVLILQVTWLLALIVDALTPEKQVEGSFVDEAYILLDWGAYHEWINDFVGLK